MVTINSFIGWVGGKRALRKIILSKFPKDFTRYIEVFGGAGWILFAKEKQKNELEVFNDIDSNLINLYRCIKEHPEELKRQFDFIPKSQELFKNAQNRLNYNNLIGGGYNNLGFTDIQRAAAYLYIIKYSFGCKKNNFVTSSNKNIQNVLERFESISDRLSNVLVENRDFEGLLKVYDKADSFFYLDPPYHTTEKYYKNESTGFSEEDHLRLRDCLNNIKGKFLLSYNDDELIRELYKNYIIEEVERNTTLSAKSNTIKFRELLIRNYE